MSSNKPSPTAVDTMIGELDTTALTFSLWQQSRSDLAETEQAVLQARYAQPPLSVDQLNELESGLAVLRARTDGLLEQALAALREYAKAGNTGA
jgi:hypothetical protein